MQWKRYSHVRRAAMYQASLEKRRREAWGSPATTAVPAFGCRRDGRADYSNPEPWSNECTVDTSS